MVLKKYKLQVVQHKQTNIYTVSVHYIQGIKMDFISLNKHSKY